MRVVGPVLVMVFVACNIAVSCTFNLYLKDGYNITALLLLLILLLLQL